MKSEDRNNFRATSLVAPVGQSSSYHQKDESGMAASQYDQQSVRMLCHGIMGEAYKDSLTLSRYDRTVADYVVT